MSVPTLSKDLAKAIWIRAQRLGEVSPFGSGSSAVRSAVEHLGYVQIDTINVIERCHHHILYNRIPKYRPLDLQKAQSVDRSVFEYWTHALSYVPVRDFRFYRAAMSYKRKHPGAWFGAASAADVKRVLKLIRDDGPITIRDIDQDVLVEKNHPWASRKPSKKALEYAFYCGDLVISERQGMVKKYELTDRHFGWDKRPKAATESEIAAYRLDRALKSQGFVTLDSVCYLIPKLKPNIKKLVEARVKKGLLMPVEIEGVAKSTFWIEPQTLEDPRNQSASLETHTHILSPFDPLVIQRKRLHAFFDYEHRFEAYLPKEKRVYGYFALPVLVDGKIVALLDLKTDRAQKTVLVQSWHWLQKKRARDLKPRVEEALGAFESFQLGV